MRESPDGGTTGTDRTPWWKTPTAFRIGIAVLCAAVIFGAWAFAQRTSDAPEIAEHASLLAKAYYDQARIAAESGDEALAMSLLEKALAADPDYEPARELLEQVRAGTFAPGETPADSPDGPPGDSPPGNGDGAAPGPLPGNDTEPDPPHFDDSDYLGAIPVVDLLPGGIEGWSRGTVVSDETAAVVSYDPRSASVAPGIVRVVFTVHDRKTEEAARAFIENVSKVVYGNAGRTIDIGSPTAYVGNDGGRLVAAAFTRGRYSFETVVISETTDLGAADKLVLEMARTLPAAR